MEASIIKELSANTVLMAAAIILLYRRLGSLDSSVKDLNKTFGTLMEGFAVQQVKHKNLTKRVDKNEKEIEKQRENTHDFRDQLHLIRGKMVTKEQLREIMKD